MCSQPHIRDAIAEKNRRKKIARNSIICIFREQITLDLVTRVATTEHRRRNYFKKNRITIASKRWLV